MGRTTTIRATTTVQGNFLRQDSRGAYFDAEALRKFHAGVARRRLGIAQRYGAFPRDKKSYITKVDGATGHGREQSVKIDGRIQYLRFGHEERASVVPAMLKVLEYLANAAAKVYSPKYYGDRVSAVSWRRQHYRDRFALMRNNRMVVAPGARFFARARSYVRKFGDAMTDTETLAVMAVQPYARRIEMGAHFKRPWTRQATRGVFRPALQLARRSNLTKILYLSSSVEWGPLPGGVREEHGPVTYGEGRNKRGRFVYTGRVMRKHRVYPVIFFGPPRFEARYGVNQSTQPWTHRPNIYQNIVQRPGGPTIASQIRRAGAIVE